MEKIGLWIRHQGDQLRISPIILKTCGGGLVGGNNEQNDHTDCAFRLLWPEEVSILLFYYSL